MMRLFAALAALTTLVVAGCSFIEVRSSETHGEEGVEPKPAVASTPAAHEPEATMDEQQGQKQDEYPKNPHRTHQLKDLERIEVEIGPNKLKTWLMNSDAKRMEGMMWLTNKEVKPDDAMLFVFKDEDYLSFWMRNTLIPLDIAYINKRKQIVRATSMKALDETGVPSNYPAMYALEMKEGAFKRLGIREGMTVKMPASVKAID